MFISNILEIDELWILRYLGYDKSIWRAYDGFITKKVKEIPKYIDGQGGNL